MINSFRTILIGGDSAKKAASRIGEFDYLCDLPFSVSAFINPSASARFQLVSSGDTWHDVPTYHTLAEAVKNDPNSDTVSIHFNAKYVLFWVQEVIKFNQLKNVVILAEDVPERDAREIVALQKKYGLNILGPSSLGMIIPGKGRVGEIGGDFKNLQLCRLDKPGPVGLITKSGGMSGELMWVISQHTPGLSGIFQIGGDAFPATDFVHWLDFFTREPTTKVVVLSGEAGGDLEERAAAWIKLHKPRYKVVAVISGRFLEQMPKGQKFGHAGAMQEESGFGSAAHKVKVLKEAGVEVVEFEELAKTLENSNL